MSLDINPVPSSLNSLTVRAHFTYITSCNARKISRKPELVFFAVVVVVVVVACYVGAYQAKAISVSLLKKIAHVFCVVS